MNNKTPVLEDAPECTPNEKERGYDEVSGLMGQDTDYANQIQDVLSKLQQMQQTPRLVTSPEKLKAPER